MFPIERKRSIGGDQHSAIDGQLVGAIGRLGGPAVSDQSSDAVADKALRMRVNVVILELRVRLLAVLLGGGKEATLHFRDRVILTVLQDLVAPLLLLVESLDLHDSSPGSWPGWWGVIPIAENNFSKRFKCR